MELYLKDHFNPSLLPFYEASLTEIDAIRLTLNFDHRILFFSKFMLKKQYISASKWVF